MKKRIAIIGAGGHGRVIAECILKSEFYDLIGFIDSNASVGTSVFGEIKVISNQENILALKSVDEFIIGIGNSSIRRKIVSEFQGKLKWATIIHPSAVVASDIELLDGTVVLANAVVNTGSKIGKFCIVDAGVIIDHDCEIGEFSHISIGTKVGSNSKLPAETKTEIGQSIKSFTVGSSK